LDWFYPQISQITQITMNVGGDCEKGDGLVFMRFCSFGVDCSADGSVNRGSKLLNLI